MKAQCERCKEIVALEFRVTGGGIEVSCPGCEARYFVAEKKPAPDVPEARPEPAPALEGGTTCPKCGARQPAGEACRKCGLVYAKWKGEASIPAIGDAREAASLWARCEEVWSDEARHDAFVDFCRRAGVLAYAAARYRQKGDTDRLAKIRAVAEQTLLAAVPRAADKPKNHRWQYVLVVFLLIVFLVMGSRLVP